METQDNRYAPPKAATLEVEPDAVPGRPQHVEWACKLLWIGFGFSALDSLLAIFVGPHSASPVADIVGQIFGLAFVFAITFWFTWKLRSGRNWMRLLITILDIIGFVVLGLVVAAMYALNYADAFFNTYAQFGALRNGFLLLQFAITIAELVLINTPTSRAWFTAMKYAD